MVWEKGEGRGGSEPVAGDRNRIIMIWDSVIDKYKIFFNQKIIFFSHNTDNGREEYRIQHYYRLKRLFSIYLNSNFVFISWEWLLSKSFQRK